ncbi:protein-L-isoaspartate O-methyltransferase family protein [Legionella oakridgensis]|uniref:Protein-L-isoaspartate O-methyltransferase n=2 Tax=Legionella oakridgensis TaxID=29423 RepID=W0B7M8_9GAMM|nr:protein-L-isoaspartate O-methyltransferase [Legionella oakridgensis]AHE66548.1 protein-L-isoaspartate carboxylmethyltransferase [Legionella oakridgensis ATCC 33761 = DSM 21215]ETO93730.1 protein-L-isoaspartate carboxylmethyltransferase [Legionella oakridgensis RV-2-2007]KTD37842.1 protein-L-isoaspartate-O-methyltransferase [Legionella oakridgensis]STY19705.1 protein-L-isoaspartate-O-methyltransferase [Legionella longbeachae]
MSTQIECRNMIKQQLRTGDVLDESILELYKTIPRDEFVPNDYKHFAYSDMQISLPHGQRMMTPLEEAQMLQALALNGNETVLEVGTGTGFLTALLSRLAKQVISLEYFADFTANARRKLTEHHCTNVELITGDACRGWLDKAPYDVMIFTGALDALTETHRLQLLPGGKLFAIIGKEPIMQGQLHTLGYNNQWQEKLIFETNIPPLINKLKPKEFVF